MNATDKITARIYQDSRNVGWAWATRVNGTHDDTGPLEGLADAASDEELIAALRGRVLTKAACEALDDDDVEIFRAYE